MSAPVQPALHVTRLGDSGPVVAFCHGLFGQGKNWTQVAKDLSSDHRVLLVDMPNHGRSPWTETFDYLDLADQVAEALRDDAPLALVGHSMGGKIAMALALRHPELVERLVVVDVSPTAYSSGREFVGYIETMRALDLSTLERRDQADEALREAVPSTTVRSFLLQNLRRGDDGWHWQVNLDLWGRDGRAGRLAGRGARGRVVRRAGAVARRRAVRLRQRRALPEMDRRFPRNRRVMVKDAGHWVHSQQPAVLIEVLRRFLG